MKLAIITPDYPPIKGGVARSVQRVAGALAQRGHTVTVIVPHRCPPNVLQTEIKSRNAGCHQVLDVFCPTKTEEVPSWHLSGLGLLPQFYLATRAYLLREPPQLIHCFTLHPLGAVCSLLAATIGVPFVISIRGNDITANMFVPWLLPQLQHVLSSANVVCPVASDLATYAINLVPSLAGRCHTISNGSDVTRSGRPCRATSKAGLDFGTIASFRPKKDLGTVLRAFSSFVEKYPESTLTVVGINDDEERNAIERQFLNVRVLPEQPHEEVLATMERLDALIISSVFEGCPNIMLESFAAGTPVIGTSVGGMRDRISDGINGLLFDPMSATQLVSCMERIMDETLRNELACAAKASLTTSEQEACEWEAAYAAATGHFKSKVAGRLLGSSTNADQLVVIRDNASNAL
jgi:glycosyltransferase involved in cell wall biosynthesis